MKKPDDTKLDVSTTPAATTEPAALPPPPVVETPAAEAAPAAVDELASYDGPPYQENLSPHELERKRELARSAAAAKK